MIGGVWRRRRQAVEKGIEERDRLAREQPLLGTQNDGGRPTRREIRLSRHVRKGHRGGNPVCGSVFLHLYGHGVALGRLGTEIEVGDVIRTTSGDGTEVSRWVTKVEEIPPDRASQDPCQRGGMPRHIQLWLSSSVPIEPERDRVQITNNTYNENSVHVGTADGGNFAAGANIAQRLSDASREVEADG